MAYFVLSLLQTSIGDRSAAAKAYGISSSVLREMGRLTSTRGDESTARKAPFSGAFLKLSPMERRWLEEAVRQILLKVGQHAAGTPEAQLDLTSLPPLSAPSAG